jgi:hypothetical protein
MAQKARRPQEKMVNMVKVELAKGNLARQKIPMTQTQPVKWMKNQVDVKILN